MTHRSSPRRLAELALFVACALLLFLVEAALPPLAPIPGIKPGLANIITLVVLYRWSRRDALLVLVVRIVLGALFAGPPLMLLFSLSGGLLAYGLYAFAQPFTPLKRLPFLAMAGACLHNLGQLVVCALVLQTPDVFWYLPPLLVSGLITGCFTGLVAQLLLSHLKKIEKRS